MDQPATTVTLEYDDRGNRTLLNDPNYGRMTSIYNSYGELEQQTNPHDDTTRFTYNKLSQTTSETSIEGTTEWLFSTTPKRIGTLESITKNNHLTNYSYDDYLRPKSVTETIAGEPYTTQFTYDELGRPKTTTHPTGITIREGYNQWGFHETVKMDQTVLWKTEHVNPLGLITQFKTGNGLVTDQTFHPLNMRLQTVKTLKQGNAPVQDLVYDWFGLGNLRNRKKGSLTESFTYDGLDRLEKIFLNGMTRGNHVYDTDDLGNILDKQSDSQAIFNDAIYGGSNGSITYGPHALSSVATSNPLLTGPSQVIHYNGFDKVKDISEGNHTLDIQYGSHKQRISQQYTNGSNSIDKVWAGACEFIIKNGQLYKHTYLSGPMGVFAVHIINPNGTEEINYIHKDHLGSWNTITDEDGSLLQELSFDAWGNRRNPATWRAFTGTAPEPLFDRGFTGHEHLYAFNLINMNGRVYDPIVGRMLSPDLFIQAPGYSQSLNRYSYCWNNPLKYTDPTGYELGVLYRNDWHWYEYRGGSNSSHGIGPGSGNHWSDPHRDVYGNFMLMSSSTFQSNYGISNDGYNNIIKNFSDFVKSRGNLITRSDGRSGYYAENSSATRTSYDAYYDENGELIVTEVWEVVSPWVNVGRRVSGGGASRNNTFLEHSGGTLGGINLLNKGRELAEWEYLRQARFNRALSGSFSQPVKHSLRALKNTGRVLGYASVALSGVDMAVNGVNVSNSLDIVMGGVAFIPGFGWAVSGLYFVGNIGWQAYSGRTIGESIQSNFIDPNESWKPW